MVQKTHTGHQQEGDLDKKPSLAQKPALTFYEDKNQTLKPRSLGLTGRDEGVQTPGWDTKVS